MTFRRWLEIELELLSALEQAVPASQMSLSRRIAVSVGSLNLLIKRAIDKGYVKVRQAPARRYVYYVTPKGFAEKSRLVGEYLDTSLAFFRLAREQYQVELTAARSAGWRHFALLGRGELADIASLAAREADVTFLGVYGTSEAQASADDGHWIAVSGDVADKFGRDLAVVITDSVDPQRAYNLARQSFPDDAILAPKFLRVARNLGRRKSDGESTGAERLN